MKISLPFSVALSFQLLALSTSALAASGLVIHSEEFGVGKFHRHDNSLHAYTAGNAWAPYVLPDQAPTNQALTRKNGDGSYTVYFSTLDDLLSSVTQISQSTGQKVSVLNVHGHGLPGAMWFPKDAATQADWQCNDWNTAATGSDADNYSQYYSATPPDEIQQIRDMSNNPNIHTGCTTGLAEWQAGVAKAPQFAAALNPDAQIHFLSCVVGLGTLGESFTQGIAQLLLPSGQGRVETSMDFGLGDWSMPQGMGFWDMQSESQVNHDNDIYLKDKKDAEIAQKGTIRMATFANRQWSTSLLANRDFLPLSYESLETLSTDVVIPQTATLAPQAPVSGPLPTRIRVPGTRAYVNVIQ